MFRWLRLWFSVLALTIVAIPATHAASQTITIQGKIGLASLVALSDAHLKAMADSLYVLAGSRAARSGEWRLIKGPLARVAKRNVAALNWFATPDGSYWSVQNGKEAGNLTGRHYFPRVLKGHTVIGDMVVSKSTDNPVAIVAVPVRGESGSVVGVLGASVYLDKLSVRLGREMALDKGVIFYSLDHTGRVGLNWDPSLIFLKAQRSGDDGLTRAMREILSKEHGTVSYRFRGRERRVLFRRSALTGWWLVFGVVPEDRETSPALPGAS